MVVYYKEQKYDDLKKQCVASGNLFVDTEFRAADSSLFYSKSPPFSTEWKRPKVSTYSSVMSIARRKFRTIA